jgi:peptidoglycan/LPS O-acetylase OafA/YrhL
MDTNVIFRITQFYTGMCIGKLFLIDNNWDRYFHVFLFLISIIGMALMYMYEIPMENGSAVNIYLIGIFSYGILSLIGEVVMRIEVVNKIIIWMSKISFPLYLLHHVISEQIISSFEVLYYQK